MNMKRLSGILTVFGLGLSAMSLNAQVVVIISAKNPISKLTQDQVSQIFLGQTKTFFTGAMAVPVDLSEGSGPRNEFYQKVTGKSAAQPPQALGSAQAVVKMVAENPKFIGYVDKAAVDGSVKVVLTL